MSTISMYTKNNLLDKKIEQPSVIDLSDGSTMSNES